MYNFSNTKVQHALLDELTNELFTISFNLLLYYSELTFLNKSVVLKKN